MSKRLGVRKLAQIALFTALIIVGGFIRFPIGAIPITLGTLFVLLGGALCGKRVGAIAPIIYLIIGLIGIPVFSAGGGITYILYPTFGYLLGFVFAGLIAGIAKKGFVKKLVCNLIGVLVIHVVGVLYFYFMSNFYLQALDLMHQTATQNPIYSGASVTLGQAIITGSLIFLPIDILSAVISALIANKLQPIINR